MNLHPRFFLVRQARVEFTELLLNWIKKHDLTYMEMIGILAGEIEGMVKFGIRLERHPNDPDKKGDEE